MGLLSLSLWFSKKSAEEKTELKEKFYALPLEEQSPLRTHLRRDALTCLVLKPLGWTIILSPVIIFTVVAGVNRSLSLAMNRTRSLIEDWKRRPFKLNSPTSRLIWKDMKDHPWDTSFSILCWPLGYILFESEYSKKAKQHVKELESILGCESPDESALAEKYDLDDAGDS